MKRMIFIVALLPAILSGCANGFEKYYQGPPNARIFPAYDSSYSPPGGKVPIYSSSDVQADTQKMLEMGFVPIGQSAFYAPDNKVSASQIQDQAQKIGAHAVLYHSSYRDTVTGAIPLTVPNNSTSYTNGTATAYGSGGYATAYGSSVTNTYGTTTTMMPYSQSRSNYEAVYFIKEHARVGIFVDPLSDSERQELQTNFAVRVRAVAQDTPAFFANVLPGDYITAVNDDPISSRDTWKSALKKYEGQDATVHFLRNGKELTKVIHINAISGGNASHVSQ